MANSRLQFARLKGLFIRPIDSNTGSTQHSVNKQETVSRQERRLESPNAQKPLSEERKEASRLSRISPSSLTNANNLAMMVHDEQMRKKAEKLHRQTLEKAQNSRNRMHTDTSHKLSESERHRAEHEEVERRLRHTLGSRRAHGKDDPDLIASMDNLATVLFEQGRREEAKALFQETLEAQTRLSGEKSAEALNSMKSLAVSLQKEGKHAQAEAMWNDVRRLSQ